MTLEHVAVWSRDIERLKEYYCLYFNGTPNDKYSNAVKGFSSYFITFEAGARLEIMCRHDIPVNKNDTVTLQHLGLIHMAFGANSRKEVDEKAAALEKAGFPILSGPRVTGDGYYEFETLDPDNNRIEVTCKA